MFNTWPLNGPGTQRDLKCKHHSFQGKSGRHRAVCPGSSKWVTAKIRENLRGKRNHLAPQCGHHQVPAGAQIGDRGSGIKKRNRREGTENNQRSEGLCQNKQRLQGWSQAIPPGVEPGTLYWSPSSSEPAWNPDLPAQPYLFMEWISKGILVLLKAQHKPKTLDAKGEFRSLVIMLPLVPKFSLSLWCRK